MEHVSVQFEIVVSWAGVGTILATNFFTGMERQDVNLEGELAVEMLGTNWTLDGGEGHVICPPVQTFIGHFVNG